MRRPPAVKPANLLHWWPLYQGAAADIIGGGDGTLQASPTAAAGRIDECLEFDSASSQYVDLTGGPYLASMSNFTVAGWQYVNASSTGTHTLYSENEAPATGNTQFITLRYDADADTYESAWRDDADTLVILTSGNTFADGEWRFIALTKSGNTKTLYVDAVSEATDATAMTTFTGITNSRLAGERSGATERFFLDGKLQDVMQWSVALTAGELRAQMNIGTYPVMYQ